MGAAGRDFHNFNMVFRNNPKYKVVGFTAAQILGISGRTYPKVLAGRFYPKGIPIYPEEKLAELIKNLLVDLVVFAYSDVSHEYVMHKASTVLANGADFILFGPKSTMLNSKKPVIAVCAVRTGAGKSPTSRKIAKYFKKKGYKLVVIRHPMPYGNLSKDVVQRFATYEDLDKYNSTIEEREEYRPHIANGTVVYAGVDYAKILERAEKEADIILFDGGNNDLPFIKPNLHIVILDPLRAGHELKYHPGEANFRMADVLIINKIDTSSKDSIKIVENNIKSTNPKATVVKANLKVTSSPNIPLRGKRVLVVEDGPTLTHGGMSFGAGMIVAKRHGVKITDAEKYAIGSIKNVYKKYPNLKKILPAMGYSKRQIKELEQTIHKSNCEIVINGSPVDLGKLIKTDKEIVTVNYELEEIGKPDLKDILNKFVKRSKL